MSPDDQPSIETQTDVTAADHTVMAVRGEVDLGTAPELEHSLTEAAERGVPVIVDLSAVGYMDSSGFRTLHRAAMAGPLLLVIPPDARLRRVVHLAGLDAILAIHDDVESARSALTG
jgi:anti-sigma B factor antagonist